MDDLDALLADLQNSVPGKNQPIYATIGAGNTQRADYGDNSGYGSLRAKAALPPTPVFQEHYSSTTETRRSLSPVGGHAGYNGSPSGPISASQSYQYQKQGALPRSAYNNGGYAQPYNANPGGNNMTELDSLLQDLSNARYNRSFERKENVVPINYSNHPSKFNTFNSTTSTESRPTVDSLLNELDNAHIYAVPDEIRRKSPTPGRHVTITVRDTKLENISGPQGPVGSIEESTVQRKDTFTPNNASAPNAYASSATKELDDLMASLSDVKLNNGLNHYHQTVTDYAKPNQGISHLTQTITETTSTVVEDTEPVHLESILKTTNMSRQGAATSNTLQKAACSACEKPIVGQVITALGKTWHPEHFICNHCNQELGTRNFFERDGFPYCEPDYHNLFSPRCAYCNGAILDKCVTALDKTWHTEHFFCAQCGQQFGEDGFHERDGKPYCRTDYFEMFAPKCNGCNRAIMENYISALSSQWHPDCFVCRDCKKAVRGKSFYAMEGKPVCPTCVGVEEDE